MAGRVHIWHTTPGEFDSLSSLSPNEVERSTAFVLDRDRKLFVSGRVLLKRVLSHYSGVNAEDWRFAVTALGKPYIEEPAKWRSLQFNLAHTLGLCVCAVAWDRAVGVDVEDVNRQIDWDGVARRFSEDEYQQILSRPLSNRPETFFSLWTLKEAYAKACGRGMALGLNDFRFDLAEDNSLRRTHPQAGDWSFLCSTLAPSYRLAAAVERSDSASQFVIQDAKLIVRAASS